MNFGLVFRKISPILLILSLLTLLPSAIAVIYGEYEDLFAFLVTAAIYAAIGFVFRFIKTGENLLTAKSGFLVVGVSWLLMSGIGALPFYVSGCIPSYADCFFETVSGFTTTGATILKVVEELPKCMLFWRSFTHWVGGMGVLVFLMAVMPLSDTRSFQLARAEIPGPTVGKLVAKLSSTARLLYGIYVVLTLLEVVMLLFGGMPIFDSFIYSFGTAGTGGFALSNAGLPDYNSAYIEGVITVFMLLFGVNFNIYFFLLVGDFKGIFKNTELRWYIGIIIASMLLITVNIGDSYSSFGEALRYSSFQVASLMSTTGFTTADYNLWPTFSKVLLVTLMFIGSCAGSTSGGLKVSRIVYIVKASWKEIRKNISARRVSALHCDGKSADFSVITATEGYFGLYMLLFTVILIFVALDGFDLVTTFTSVVACFNNIGPGLEAVGAVGNYSAFSVPVKLVLSFAMLAGRLEIYPMLLLFSPKSWKK